MAQIQSHEDLIVWQKSMEYAAQAYSLAKLMPRAEQFRLTNQILRAAASIPANIAEGHSRGTRKDYANFIAIARGSLAEADTLVKLAIKVQLLRPEQGRQTLDLGREVGRMLNSLLARLRTREATDLKT